MVAEATPERMREALDEVLLRSLPIIGLVLTVLFVGLALLTPISDPDHVAFFATQDALNALFFLALYVGFRRRTPNARLAHPLAAIMVAVLLLGSLTEFIAQPVPLETVGFMLVAIGAGLFFTSRAWFAGTMISVVLAWGAAVWLAPPSPLTIPLATLLVQGIFLAVMAFEVRLRGLRRLVTLRAHDLRQAADLESAARELAASGSRFRLLAENAQDVVYRYVVSPVRRVEYVSPSATALTGYSPDEFYANPALMLDIIHPEDRPAIERDLKRVLEGAQEFRLVRKDGNVVWCEQHRRAFLSENGKLMAIEGFVRDITSRKGFERRLAAQHAATRVLAEGSDEEQTESALLEAVASELGWAFGAVWLVHEGDDVLRCTNTWREPAEGRSAFEEASRARSFTRAEGLPGRVWSTGEPAWIRDVTRDPNFPRATDARVVGLHGAFAFPIPVGGRVVGVIEFFSRRVEEPDPELLRLMVTVGAQYGQFLERRHAEESIRRLNAQLERSVTELAQKNHDLETFSYTASHDLRAPLRAIDLLSSVLLEDEAAHLDASGQDTLHRLRRETMRMSQLVDDLLKLSRSASGDLHIEPIDLARLARDVVDELRQRDPARRIDITVPPQIQTLGDARLLRVALENMLENAWKYTSKTASARIEVGSLPGKRGEPRTFFVRDNGAGFDMEQVGRLFQPFQRLHGNDFPGTGIGLATVHRIVHRHGGRIWAEGQVGRGATFYFTTEGSEDHPSAPPPPQRQGVSRAP